MSDLNVSNGEKTIHITAVKPGQAYTLYTPRFNIVRELITKMNAFVIIDFRRLHACIRKMSSEFKVSCYEISA